jgi:hypothetical protein
MSNFTKGSVSAAGRLVFAGDVWVEETQSRGSVVPWKAGYQIAERRALIEGDCQLELTDGRIGLMKCTKAQPSMSGGTQFQFDGLGPFVRAEGGAAPEVLSERIDLRITKADRALYRAAAEAADLDLLAWLRDRLTQAAQRELGND